MRNVQQKEVQMMELVPLALESAAFVSLLSLNSISADILILSHLNTAYFVMLFTL